MLSTLILKEIHETIITYRFLIATLLCLILIPLGMYVSLKDYEKRYADYQDSIHLYQDNSKGKIYARFRAQGYRPPSPLSIFSLGLKYTLPEKVLTSHDGQFTIERQPSSQSPQSVLFGEVDFNFIMSFVLSILALIFTFNRLSGEKEAGSLRLVISNSVPRWKIILAKILGNYLIFLVPFFIGLLVALVILVTYGDYPLFSKDIFPSFMAILLISLVFIFVIFNLGILISSKSHSSITSMISALFAWVIIVLIVPKICPMIANIIYPVKAQQVVTVEKQMAKRDLEKELDSKRKESLERIMINRGVDPQTISIFGIKKNSEEMKAMQQYDKDIIPIENEYKDLINNAIKKIEQDYNNKRNTQRAIAINLSRISPTCSYTYLLSEISGTGFKEIENFNKHAQKFQQQVENDVYNNFIPRRYIFGGNDSSWEDKKDGFDPQKVAVPNLVDYKNVTLIQALKTGWTDILILLLFAILFFTASFVSFLRYDVR